MSPREFSELTLERSLEGWPGNSSGEEYGQACQLDETANALRLKFCDLAKTQGTMEIRGNTMESWAVC